MRKFAVCSGFLGAGKTSVMMALSRTTLDNHGKIAMICNDLGSEDLADNRYAALQGCNVSELTGSCICYQRENLAARLDRLFEQEGCELVLSDIPGFGVGALDHVYHGLRQDYPGRYELAPFLVVVEMRTLDYLRNGEDQDLRYILHAQLLEADLIALNKCDLLSAQALRQGLSYLENAYPQACALGVSALTGQGIDTLARKLTQGTASLRKPEIGYGGAEFRHAMGRMSEFNCRFFTQVCCNDFDGTAYLCELAERIRVGVRAAGGEIPHLKLLAWSDDGDFARVDLLGIHRPVEICRPFERYHENLAIILNSSAACDAAALQKVMTTAISEAAERFRLSDTIFQTEWFDIGKP